VIKLSINLQKYDQACIGCDAWLEPHMSLAALVCKVRKAVFSVLVVVDSAG